MKVFFALLLLSFTAFGDTTLSWVDKQIEAIKPPRPTIPESQFSKVEDPFIFINVKKLEEKNAVTAKKRKRNSYKKKYKVKLSLSIIMNNKARINSKWYKLGDTLYGYKLTKIDSNRVVLTKRGRTRILSTYTKKKNLIIKDRK